MDKSPLTGTPPVFFKTEDLTDPNSVKDYAVCKAVAQCIGSQELIGCQRTGKVWRVYTKTLASRVKLLTNKLKLGSQLIHVYSDNPLRSGAKNPDQEIIKITVKDLPLSKGNTTLQSYLEGQKVKMTRPIQYAKARDPDTHELSPWLNGDRIIYADKLSSPLPRNAVVSDSPIRIFHDGQPPIQKDKLCTQCYETDHFRSQCKNPPACNRCRKPGHSPGDSKCPASLPKPQKDIYTIAGKDDPLSNFFPCEMRVFGMSVKSAEHAYQYSKAVRRGELDQAKLILDAGHAAEAKRQARYLKPDPNWKDQREDVMSQILHAKADQVQDFRKALKNTKNATLAHSIKNEVFWATGLDSQDTLHTKQSAWMGKNQLGKMLEDIRTKMKDQSKAWHTNTPKGQRDKKQSRNTRSTTTPLELVPEETPTCDLAASDEHCASDEDT